MSQVRNPATVIVSRVKIYNFVISRPGGPHWGKKKVPEVLNTVRSLGLGADTQDRGHRFSNTDRLISAGNRCVFIENS